jgi:hypothetical protein
MIGKRWLFIIINLVFMLLGIALIGVGLAIAEDDGDGIAVQTIFDECFIVFGLTVFLIGTCGVFGGIYQYPILLRCFLTMVLILLLTQLSVVLYAILAGTYSTLGQLIWNNVGQDIRDQIQIKLRCCGFDQTENAELENVTLERFDEPEPQNPIPQSCYNPETSEIWSDPCNKALWAYIARDQSDMFYLIVFIVALQILQIGISMSLISDTVRRNEDKISNILVPK